MCGWKSSSKSLFHTALSPLKVKDGKLVEKGGSTAEAKAEADKENAAKSALGEENAKSLDQQIADVRDKNMQDVQNSRAQAKVDVFKKACC